MDLESITGQTNRHELSLLDPGKNRNTNPPPIRPSSTSFGDVPSDKHLKRNLLADAADRSIDSYLVERKSLVSTDGTNEFLYAVGFPHEDITRMALAYSGRLIFGRPTDLFKKAIQLYGDILLNDASSTQIDKSQYAKIRKDIIASMEILLNTWHEKKREAFKKFSCDTDLVGIAQEFYEGLISLCTTTKIGVLARAGIDSQKYLVDKYLFDRPVEPNALRISFGPDAKS